MALPKSRIFRERYRRYRAEQDEPDVVKQIRKIVDEKQAGRVAGHTVDLFTASALMAVWNALTKPEAQEKFVRMAEANIVGLASFAFKHLEGKRRVPEVQEALSIGDQVVYGPAAQGRPFPNQEVGRVVDLDEIAGVSYATVTYGPGRKDLHYPVDDFTKIEGFKREQRTVPTVLREAGANDYEIKAIEGMLARTKDSMELYYLLDDLGTPEDVKERILAAMSSYGFVESKKHEANWEDYERYEIHTWFERDRAHVELRDKATQETVIEWWDEDVQETVEMGFLNPNDWLGSAIDYARHLGVI